MKVAERERARFLREVGGYSIGYIADLLGVSKSSVSTWTRDVELSPEQHAALTEGLARTRGTESSRRRRREERIAYQDSGRAIARAGSPLHLAGCMLHWAEGSNRRNTVVFTNSDPAMVRFYLRFLRECYDVEDECVRFSVNCFLGNGLELQDIERWWLDQLDLPLSCLRRATVNRASRASSAKRPPLLYGTGRLVVHSTAIMQSIFGAIQEYAGIERPEWLDL